MKDKSVYQRLAQFLTGTGNRIVQVDANGNETATQQLIAGKITDSTTITRLTTESNWLSDGSYNGTAITGTYEGQYYSDVNYIFFAYADNSWKRYRINNYFIGSYLLQADNETNLTAKVARYFCKHYTNAEEPLTAIAATSNSTDNLVRIGGGTATGNAATQVRMYTAANNTTTTGTDRGGFNSAGIFDLQNVPEYADNAAAITGGLTAGQIYRTSGTLKIVI